MQQAARVASAPLIRVKNVSKSFGKSPRRFVALRDVALDIVAGEFVCIVGPSGCGKSTLLRLITGLTEPTKGKILYRGQVLTGVNPHATIVFQTFALFPWLSVVENVQLALKARGVSMNERQKRAEHLIELVGLSGFESAYPRELSGGMRQKVGFARAMAMEPELLCLDEPFSALDVLSAEALRGELIELWLKRAMPTQAILMITHNIEEAVELADRVVVMAKDPGRIVAEIPVTLRHPRGRKDIAFQAMVDRVYGAVTGRSGGDADMQIVVPGLPGITHRLPNATLEALAGLLEKVAAETGKMDLPRVATELGSDLQELLPMVEAAERLGLARAETGDLMLLPAGQTFAEASIPARKELIAGRALRIPLVRWIYETLQQDDDNRVDRDYFIETLRAGFGDAAEEQIDIAVDWGRYAELFGYDNDTGELYLEP